MGAHSRKEVALTDAADMLAAILADDREVWLKVGMALHSEFGDDGFSLWDDWSQSADSYREKDARAVWRSFKGGGVGIGTLIHLARENGYSADTGQHRPLPKPKPAPKPITRDTGRYAAELWLKSAFDDAAVGSHQYALKKGIDWAAGAGRGKASGRVVGKDADCLIVPIREHGTGKVRAVQCINSQGNKQTFGAMADGYLLLGNPLDKSLPWAVVEGWADAVSFVFHWHRGNAVAIAAFGLGRMDAVAKSVAAHHSPRELMIVEDAT